MVRPHIRCPFAEQVRRERDLCRAHDLGLLDLAAPTPYRPGSEEKVAVIGARYIAGLPLFHAGDMNAGHPGPAATPRSQQAFRIRSRGDLP